MMELDAKLSDPTRIPGEFLGLDDIVFGAFNVEFQNINSRASDQIEYLPDRHEVDVYAFGTQVIFRRHRSGHMRRNPGQEEMRSSRGDANSKLEELQLGVAQIFNVPNCARRRVESVHGAAIFFDDRLGEHYVLPQADIDDDGFAPERVLKDLPASVAATVKLECAMGAYLDARFHAEEALDENASFLKSLSQITHCTSGFRQYRSRIALLKTWPPYDPGLRRIHVNDQHRSTRQNGCRRHGGFARSRKEQTILRPSLHARDVVRESYQ
jgi:hypothetical protein